MAGDFRAPCGDFAFGAEPGCGLFEPGAAPAWGLFFRMTFVGDLDGASPVAAVGAAVAAGGVPVPPAPLAPGFAGAGDLFAPGVGDFFFFVAPGCGLFEPAPAFLAAASAGGAGTFFGDVRCAGGCASAISFGASSVCSSDPFCEQILVCLCSQ